MLLRTKTQANSQLNYFKRSQHAQTQTTEKWDKNEINFKLYQNKRKKIMTVGTYADCAIPVDVNLFCQFLLAPTQYCHLHHILIFGMSQIFGRVLACKTNTLTLKYFQ